MPTNNKEYQTKYYSKWYQRHKSEHIRNVGIRRDQVVNDNRTKLSLYLETHPCVDCGESDPIVLEFDHKEQSNKDCNVSKLILSGYSWNRISKEIDKCQVRCANCHRRRTAKQLNWHKKVVGAERLKLS